MNATQLIALIKVGGSILWKTKELMDKNYGLIHKRTPAVIDGKRGFLVWDYVLLNEITFEAYDGKMYSFFTSISDKETEKVWNELVRKYGN